MTLENKWFSLPVCFQCRCYVHFKISFRFPGSTNWLLSSSEGAVRCEQNIKEKIYLPATFLFQKADTTVLWAGRW